MASMSKPYAQLAAVVFFAVGFGGFLTGDAGHVVHGNASGNFGSIELHLTYLHDVINLLLAAAFAYAGWFAAPRLARTIVLACGGFLLLLTVVGFALTDTAAGTRSVVTLHFTLALNILDLVASTLALLCGLGDFGSEPTGVRQS